MRVLNALYAAGAILAAVFMVLIAVLTLILHDLLYYCRRRLLVGRNGICRHSTRTRRLDWDDGVVAL